MTTVCYDIFQARLLLNKASSPKSINDDSETSPIIRKPNVKIPEHRRLSQNYQSKTTTSRSESLNGARGTSTDPFGYTDQNGDDDDYEDEYAESLDVKEEEAIEEVHFPLILPREDLLMYNPVPKTGSTSMADMLKRYKIISRLRTSND